MEHRSAHGSQGYSAKIFNGEAAWQLITVGDAQSTTRQAHSPMAILCMNIGHVSAITALARRMLRRTCDNRPLIWLSPSHRISLRSLLCREDAATLLTASIQRLVLRTSSPRPQPQADAPASGELGAENVRREGNPADNAGVSVEDLIKRNQELTDEVARLAEAVAARDAFIAVAAHELRNPMTPIVARVDMLRRAIGKASIEKIDQSLEQIQWLIARFLKRATTILDVSRMTSKKFTVSQVEVDVCEAAASVVENFRPLVDHSRSTLALELPNRPVAILGDRLALEQILDNLVSNAIKYGAGKPIVVSVLDDTERGHARIAVRDEGPGISAENQARIFERFERAVKPGDRAGGFGVGLWIVQQLCEAMGGAIEVTSSPGEGSAFSITLPLYQVSPTE